MAAAVEHIYGIIESKKKLKVTEREDVNGNHHQVTFDQIILNMNYDFPDALYEQLYPNNGIILSNKAIIKILASHIPEELNYETYQVCGYNLLNFVPSFIQIIANSFPYFFPKHRNGFMPSFF